MLQPIQRCSQTWRHRLSWCLRQFCTCLSIVFSQGSPGCGWTKTAPTSPYFKWGFASAQWIGSGPEWSTTTSDHDIWTYIWGSPFFSSAKAYTHLTGHRFIHPIFHKLWASACQPKHKFFFWLLLHHRLSTRNILPRKNMQLPSFNCVCCPSNIEESLKHLFLQCNFTQSCWATLDLQVVTHNPFAAFGQFKLQLHVSFYMEIIIIMCWCIWMQHNDLIFRGIQPSSANYLAHFKKKFALVILRAKNRHEEPMSLWLDHLV